MFVRGYGYDYGRGRGCSARRAHAPHLCWNKQPQPQKLTLKLIDHSLLHARMTRHVHDRDCEMLKLKLKLKIFGRHFF